MPPRYLPDTSAWHRSLLVSDRWGDLLEGDELALCAPVRLELLYSARDAADYAAIARGLDDVWPLPLDARAEAAAGWAQSALAATGHHRAPTPVDLLIAAVAEVNDVTLLHCDRHFDVIADVTGQPAEWLVPRGTL